MIKRSTVLVIVLSIIIITLLLGCNDYQNNSSIAVFYNDPGSYNKPSYKSESGIGLPLIELINEAEISIDFAIYGIRNQPDITNALTEAIKRGVKVRGLVDKDINNENYYSDTNDFISRFENIKTDYQSDLYKHNNQEEINIEPYWSAPEGFDGPPQCVGYSIDEDTAIIAVHASKKELKFVGDIMHNKFFIIDDKKVWTGSTNISDTGTGGYNANIACIIENGQIAGIFTEEFNQMFEDSRFHTEKIISDTKATNIKIDHDTNVSIFFSPQDSSMEKGIVNIINNAKKKINISVFFLTHKKITAELIKAYNRGIDIRIIIDATAASNGYTKHEILRTVGIPVKVENWGGKMHMKSASVDGKILVIGSMNWTSAGDKYNDENIVIIKNRELTKEFDFFFERLWDSIPNEYLKENPPPESKKSVNSMSDGVDNDYDGLTDNEDDDTPGKIELPPHYIVPKIEGYSLIKGVINKNGYWIYVLPNSKYYEQYLVNRENEGYFPSIEEANEAGFEKFEYYMAND